MADTGIETKRENDTLWMSNIGGISESFVKKYKQPAPQKSLYEMIELCKSRSINEIKFGTADTSESKKEDLVDKFMQEKLGAALLKYDKADR
jgi:hypothetical protein